MDILSELEGESRSLALGCLAFIDHCDLRRQYPDWRLMDSEHDCCRSGCARELFLYSDSHLSLAFCEWSGLIHFCGEPYCCYGTFTTTVDETHFCFLTGKVLTTQNMPGHEWEWDDRLDKKRITQTGKESGDSKGTSRKRARPAERGVWKFHDLELRGRSFPRLAKENGEQEIAEAMERVCHELFQSTTAARVGKRLGRGRLTVPPTTLTNAKDLARQLRLLVIHSKPYETFHHMVGAEHLCLYVLYRWMRTGRKQPLIVDTPSDAFVKEYLPKLADLSLFDLTCQATGRAIKMSDVNKTDSRARDSFAYWHSLRSSPDTLLLKRWMPAELEPLCIREKEPSSSVTAAPPHPRASVAMRIAQTQRGKVLEELVSWRKRQKVAFE